MNTLRSITRAALVWLAPFTLFAILLAWQTDWGRAFAREPAADAPVAPAPLSVALLPASTAGAVTPVVVTDDDSDAHDLVGHMTLVRDPRGSLEIADVFVRAPETLDDVEPGAGGVVWIRVSVRAESAPREAWYLSAAPPIDPGTVYFREGDRWRSAHFGPRDAPVLRLRPILRNA